MKLSLIEYYSDFVAYPVLILLLAAFGLSVHHHIDGDVNFGVTTGFWDRVFRADSPRLRPVVGVLNPETRSP